MISAVLIGLVIQKIITPEQAEKIRLKLHKRIIGEDLTKIWAEIKNIIE